MTYARPVTQGAEPDTEITSFNFSDQFGKLIIIYGSCTYLKFHLSCFVCKSDAMHRVVSVYGNSIFSDFPECLVFIHGRAS